MLRFFIAIRFAFSLITLALLFFFPVGGLRRTEGAPVISLVETGLLLVVLSMHWFQDRLRRAYLPIVLLWATAGPVVENTLAFLTYWTNSNAFQVLTPQLAEEVGRQALTAGQFQLFILLLVPMILISWLYPYRYLVNVTLLLSALDILPLVVVDASGVNGLWRVTFGTLLRALVFLFLGYVVNRLVADLKNQNQQLAGANRRLASYATTLEQLATSRERNRLAREFHDTVAHTLSAVAVQLEAVRALAKTNPEQAEAMLDQSLAVTRSGLNETRRAILSLRAAPLEDLGLRMALENLARSNAERYGWSLTLDLSDRLDNLPPEAEHSIYRMAEEGLRNAGLHAQAHNVTMKLTRPNGKLEFIIEDDGQGFTYRPEDAEDHFGLRGMKERAMAIGGALTVESIPGQGTRLDFTLEEFPEGLPL